MRKFDDTPREAILSGSTLSLEQAESKKRSNDVPPRRSPDKNPRIPRVPPEFSAPLIGPRHRQRKGNVSQDARKYGQPTDDRGHGDKR